MHNSICAFNFRPNPTVSLNPRYFTTIFYKSLFEKIKKKESNDGFLRAELEKARKCSQIGRIGCPILLVQSSKTYWRISIIAYCTVQVNTAFELVSNISKYFYGILSHKSIVRCICIMQVFLLGGFQLEYVCISWVI